MQNGRGAQTGRGHPDLRVDEGSILAVMIFVPTQHWRECQALQVLWKAEGAQERHVCQSGVQSSETAQKTKVFICSPQ